MNKVELKWGGDSVTPKITSQLRGDTEAEACKNEWLNKFKEAVSDGVISEERANELMLELGVMG